MTTLDKGAIEAVSTLAKATVKPSKITDPRTGRDRIVAPDGTILPEARAALLYNATTPSGLADMAGDRVPAAAQGRAFVGPDRVDVVLDEAGEAVDLLRLGLTRTRGFRVLAADALDSMDQAELLWELRSLFPDAVAPADFLPALRKLRFNTHNSGGVDVSQGREPRDLSVERTVRGGEDAAEFAETVTLSTPVFEQLAAEKDKPMFEITCAVRVNLEERTFTLRPLDGELLRATTEALDHIAGVLEQAPFAVEKQADWRVFRGATAAQLG